jgi:uncharacterized protein (DUF2236 family)
MEYFVAKDSIVRQIWGRPDTVLFIFAGAAAEFAINKAVDWLYFTGRLPADPLGRLFSTVVYARLIIFSPLDEANRYIDQITHIHKTVEQNRGAEIPGWAYRDVLFMLIWYSIRSYEVLYDPLNETEKEEVFAVFYRVGLRMGLTKLPLTYTEWQQAHQEHIINDTIRSGLTTDLYKQYRKHLGAVRYSLLKKVQSLMIPEQVRQKLGLTNAGTLLLLIDLYKFSRLCRMDRFVIEYLLPPKYKPQLRQIKLSGV